MRGLPIAFALALSCLSSTSRAAGSRVVIFPLDAKAVSEGSAKLATERVIATLKAVPNLKVIDPRPTELKLGSNLTEQARACNYDVFCLVEIGEILQVERMLIGHVRRPSGEEGEGLELKLIVLDVAKAVIGEVLIWRLPEQIGDAWPDAVEAAARRMFSSPDALVDVTLEPVNARVSIYGEPFEASKKGEPSRFWSGVYYVRATADGYHPMLLKIVVAKDVRTKLPISLEPDPLWVPPDKRPRDTTGQPFDRTSRREGSGVSAREVAVQPLDAGSPIEVAIRNPVPWVVAGAGVGVVVIGAVVMSSAQGNYNELSGQQRFAPGKTATVDIAVRTRDDARGGYTLGSVLATTGVAAIVGAGLWMILSATVFSEEPAPSATRATVAPNTTISPPLAAAARGLVADAFGGSR